MGLLFDFFGRSALAAADSCLQKVCTEIMMAERHDLLPLAEVDALAPLLFAESPPVTEQSRKSVSEMVFS